jgi:low temperature requirement protein LtrA
MSQDPHENPATLLRARTGEHHSRVGFIELFFDLVFVFAITQISHTLLHHLTLEGALEATFLLFAVWTIWIFTAWVTNWLDTEKAPTRLMLFALMAAGLVLSSSLPEAFGERGLSFAIAYAAIQVGRTVYMVFALRKGPENERRNFQRILTWLLVSAPFWIVGGFADEQHRWMWWAAALFIEALGPWAMFWTPFQGRSSTADWTIDPAHLAERAGLFIIIALGESVLIIGATFAETAWTAQIWLAFGASLASSLAMWWIYFALIEHEAARLFARHEDPGAVARAGYTYAHIPMVAGIIVMAVADEMVLAHPSGHASPEMLAAIIVGPVLFLAGVGLFCGMMWREFPPSPIVATLALLGLIPLSPHVEPVILSLISTGVMVATALWETWLTSTGKYAAPQQTRPASAD